MKTKHMLLTLIITLLLITTINAADTNNTVTQTEKNTIQVTNNEQITNNIETIKETKSTIKLKEGNYDSFNINWDKKDKELIIDGNSQQINGEISITVGKNSKLTINSVTLNHTGKTPSKIINNGILLLNNVHVTNTEKEDQTEGYHYDAPTLEDIDNFQNTRKNRINNKTNTTGITITNNNRLIINNSTINDNHLQTSIITNNYITSINNTVFTYNYAESLIENNAKLLINNTIIDKDNIYSLVKVGNEDPIYNPELAIINTCISYNQLENYIIDDNYYSKLIIINSTFKNVTTPYGFPGEDEELCLEKCGEAYLADNRVYGKSYINNQGYLIGVNNTITFSQNNQTRKIWDEYYETKNEAYDEIQYELIEFMKYFTENRKMPVITAYYDTGLSVLKVNLTEYIEKSIIEETLNVEISDEEGTTLDYTINSNDEIFFNDSTVNDASEIIITFDGNDDYYDVMKTYTLQPVTLIYNDYYEEDYTNVIRQLRTSSLYVNDLETAYKPGDNITLNCYVFSEEDIITNPYMGKIYFSFDNNTIPLTLNPNGEKIEITYTIPPDTEYGEYIVNVTFKHPEYLTSKVSDIIYVTNETEEYIEDEYLDDEEEYYEDYDESSEDEFDEEPDDENYDEEEDLDENEEELTDYNEIIVDDIYQQENNIIIEGQIIIPWINDYANNVNVIIYHEDGTVTYSNSTIPGYDDGYFQKIFTTDELTNGYNNITISYGDYIDEEYIELSTNITLEIEKTGTYITLKSYTLYDEEIIDDENIIYETIRGNITPTSNIAGVISMDKALHDKYSNIKKNNPSVIGINSQVQENNHQAIKKSIQTTNSNRHVISVDVFKRGTGITLGMLNNIFGMDFSCHTLLIYIGEELVYNGTVTDNLLEILFKISDQYSTTCTLKVIVEDKEYAVTLKSSN